MQHTDSHPQHLFGPTVDRRNRGQNSLTPDQIGEYTGQRKEIRPITVATYQTITYHKRGMKEDGVIRDVFPHFDLFDEGDWGLIIYDEVHLLPAPVFSITAELQARRRLGLTATLGARRWARGGCLFADRPQKI